MPTRISILAEEIDWGTLIPSFDSSRPPFLSREEHASRQWMHRAHSGREAHPPARALRLRQLAAKLATHEHYKTGAARSFDKIAEMLHKSNVSLVRECRGCDTRILIPMVASACAQEKRSIVIKEKGVGAFMDGTCDDGHFSDKVIVICNNSNGVCSRVTGMRRCELDVNGEPLYGDDTFPPRHPDSLSNVVLDSPRTPDFYVISLEGAAQLLSVARAGYIIFENCDVPDPRLHSAYAAALCRMKESAVGGIVLVCSDNTSKVPFYRELAKRNAFACSSFNLTPPGNVAPLVIRALDPGDHNISPAERVGQQEIIGSWNAFLRRRKEEAKQEKRNYHTLSRAHIIDDVVSALDIARREIYWSATLDANPTVRPYFLDKCTWMDKWAKRELHSIVVQKVAKKVAALCHLDGPAPEMGQRTKVGLPYGVLPTILVIERSLATANRDKTHSSFWDVAYAPQMRRGDRPDLAFRLPSEATTTIYMVTRAGQFPCADVYLTPRTEVNNNKLPCIGGTIHPSERAIDHKSQNPDSAVFMMGRIIVARRSEVIGVDIPNLVAVVDDGCEIVEEKDMDGLQMSTAQKCNRWTMKASIAMLNARGDTYQFSSSKIHMADFINPPVVLPEEAKEEAEDHLRVAMEKATVNDYLDMVPYQERGSVGTAPLPYGVAEKLLLQATTDGLVCIHKQTGEPFVTPAGQIAMEAFPSFNPQTTLFLLAAINLKITGSAIILAALEETRYRAVNGCSLDAEDDVYHDGDYNILRAFKEISNDSGPESATPYESDFAALVDLVSSHLRATNHEMAPFNCHAHKDRLTDITSGKNIHLMGDRSFWKLNWARGGRYSHITDDWRRRGPEVTLHEVYVRAFRDDGLEDLVASIISIVRRLKAAGYVDRWTRTCDLLFNKTWNDFLESDKGCTLSPDGRILFTGLHVSLSSRIAKIHRGDQEPYYRSYYASLQPVCRAETENLANREWAQYTTTLRLVLGTHQSPLCYMNTIQTAVFTNVIGRCIQDNVKGTLQLYVTSGSLDNECITFQFDDGNALYDECVQAREGLLRIVEMAVRQCPPSEVHQKYIINVWRALSKSKQN